jgi:hypothetical protein
VLRAYAKMLPRIQAEKTLTEYQLRVAAGELRMKTHARDLFLEELQQRAAGAQVRRRVQPISRMGLQAMGIKAVYHPRPKAKG